MPRPSGNATSCTTNGLIPTDGTEIDRSAYGRLDFGGLLTAEGHDMVYTRHDDGDDNTQKPPVTVKSV